MHSLCALLLIPVPLPRFSFHSCCGLVMCAASADAAADIRAAAAAAAAAALLLLPLLLPSRFTPQPDEPSAAGGSAPLPLGLPGTAGVFDVCRSIAAAAAAAAEW